MKLQNVVDNLKAEGYSVEEQGELIQVPLKFRITIKIREEDQGLKFNVYYGKTRCTTYLFAASVCCLGFIVTCWTWSLGIYGYIFFGLCILGTIIPEMFRGIYCLKQKSAIENLTLMNKK